MKILIDNGHGIETPGKRSPDGILREYRYNREIAAVLVHQLRERGYDADLLVPEDEDIPLTVRARRVNRMCETLGKDNVLLVSIHCNAAPPDDGGWHNARGWSAYTTEGFTESDVFADFLYAAAEEVFTKEKGLSVRKFRDAKYDKDWEAQFYILRKTSCPAVLTENFFQDNKADVKYMLSAAGRKDIVSVHLTGIENYLKNRKK